MRIEKAFALCLRQQTLRVPETEPPELLCFLSDSLPLVRRGPSSKSSSGTSSCGGPWFPHLHEGVGGVVVQMDLTRLSLSPSSCAPGTGALAGS